MKHSQQLQPARFVVGIDLGTTNSAVAFVDTRGDRDGVQVFAVPQLVAPGEVEARDTLPSFHYEAAPGELVLVYGTSFLAEADESILAALDARLSIA